MPEWAGKRRRQLITNARGFYFNLLHNPSEQIIIIVYVDSETPLPIAPLLPGAV